MRLLLLLSLVFLICMTQSWATDLTIGTSYNTRLVWQQKSEYMAIPFKKRVKEVFYADPGQQIIKGVIARDLDKTLSSATVTAGGVGSSFVNIRLKSERGGSLNYQIDIYV
ncbi:unnamed protein product [Leptidea sinapis]|uniref:Salivary secreted peptide n=1 Tax=Leptidea sinapis TaxID=189913 RepID=A0A5E4PV45_9NEOP|nr:unnamed protein product [Leptidea sinapis]